MEHAESNEAKDRIIKASIQLFSKKGFDAARVNEIADAANVNKALIYYYFKSKEDILDYLMKSLLDSITSIAMDFIHGSIVHMIKDGRLDIEPDRLHFANEEALDCFLKNAVLYYEQVLDYALEHRAIIRILMLESLKNSKHHNALFRFLDLTKESSDNPIYRTISEADKDFNYSGDLVLFEFFFQILPLVSFAAYFDDYRKISGMSDKELRSSFLGSFHIIAASLVSGRDILLRSKNI